MTGSSVSFFIQKKNKKKKENNLVMGKKTESVKNRS